MAEFENIKVGDNITTYYHPRFERRTYIVISKVVKVTPKQFVNEHGRKWRKEDGSLIGGWLQKCALSTDEDILTIAEITSKYNNKVE